MDGDDASSSADEAAVTDAGAGAAAADAEAAAADAEATAAGAEAEEGPIPADDDGAPSELAGGFFTPKDPDVQELLTKMRYSDIQELLSRLRFIAKIKPGERVNVGTLSVQTEGFGTGVCRRWQAEGRKTTLAFLRQTIEASLEAAQACSGPSGELDDQLRHLILTCLRETRAGITALARTYDTDRMFVSRAETLREMVGLRAAEIDGGSP